MEMFLNIYESKEVKVIIVKDEQRFEKVFTLVSLNRSRTYLSSHSSVDIHSQRFWLRSTSVRFEKVFTLV